MGVVVITDSGCDLPREQARQDGIEIVPVYILFGDERLRDGVDIDRATFYRRMKSGEAAKTEPPSADDFKAAFARATSAGDDVVCITLSSQFSQSYAGAKAASAEFPRRVFLVDSRSACGMQVLLSRYAVELARKGLGAAEIARTIDPHNAKAFSYFAVPDLNQFARSGRLPKALVALGTMLNVSLVLKINEAGAIGPAGQSRSFEKTCEIMVDAVVRGIERSPAARIALSHAQAPDTAKKLLGALEEKLGHPAAYETVNEAACTIAAHLGSGAVGLFAIVP